MYKPQHQRLPPTKKVQYSILYMYPTCIIRTWKLVGVKEVISQQVGLGVKADTPSYTQTRVSTLAP